MTFPRQLWLLRTETSPGSGIISLTLHSAKGLEQDVSPQAQVSLGHDSPPIYTTSPQKDSPIPLWEATHDFYCPYKGLPITVKLVDHSSSVNRELGQFSIPLEDLLEACEEGPMWWSVTGSKSGKLMISAVWTPVDVGH